MIKYDEIIAKSVQLIEQHKKRLARAGKNLWKEVENLSNMNGKVSGKLAMEIADNYGMRYQDIIFLCASHKLEIDMIEFCTLIFITEEKKKNTVLCRL